MITSKEMRRPLLALIAGSALLLGGAAMPKFCLHNPTMLYALGEFRMAIGDQEGGLRMISHAAEQRSMADPSVVQAAAPAAARAVANDPAKCTRTVAKVQPSVSKARPTMVSYRFEQGPTSGELMNLAKLERTDFASVGFDQARFTEEMQRATEAERSQHLRRTMAHVRSELERRGIAVPEIPAPPIAVTVTP
jgi:hypothetical protein